MANNKLQGGGNAIGNALSRVGQNALDQFNGILSTRRIAKYASGARTILRINGEIVGFAFSINWSIRTEGKELRSVDDYLPTEIVPTTVSVSGSIGAFHIPNASPTKKQYMSNILSFPHHKYITIEVRDSQTDSLLFFTNRAQITSRSEQLNAEQLGRMQLEFKAIGWLDEIKPDIPTPYRLPGSTTQSTLDQTPFDPTGRRLDEISSTG